MGLFDVGYSINGIDFNTFKKEDISYFDNICDSVEYKELSWFDSIGHLYPYSLLYEKIGCKLLWKEIGKFIFIVGRLKTGRLYMYTTPIPISEYSNKERIDAYNEFTEILSKCNKSSDFDAIEFILPKDYERLNKDVTKSKVGLGEFIFDCDKLIELKGSKYKNRRIIINGFVKNYPNHSIRFATKEDIPSIIKVREKWISNLSKRYPKIKVWDKDLFYLMLDCYDFMDYRITVVEVDGNIEGFCIIRRFCKDCMTVLTENANEDIKGVTEWLWYNSLRLNRDLGKFENDSNGGTKEDGLYKYKLNHRPEDILEFYNVTSRMKGKEYIKAFEEEK